ncbi:MAG TPA: tetratricopeptide repeat protein [Vicinamibacteria bacterium]|nr:tetratricopeptide repeat protein [Vicinamibacteria bacterium]
MGALLFVLAVATQSGDAADARSRAEAYYQFSLGLQSRLTGEAKEALEAYDRAQKLDPAAGAVRTETARLLMDMGRFDDALGEAEAGVRLDPEDPEAHFTLGRVLQVQSEVAGDAAALKRAAAEYEAAVRLRAGDVFTLRILADGYRRLGDAAGAASAWERALEYDPNNYDGWVQLGSHYLALGQPEKAAGALQHALEIRPGSSEALVELGDTYAQANQVEQAVLHYRKALEIEPRDFRTRLSLGDVLLGAHRPKEALAEAQAILDADAKNPGALDLRGRALREMRDFDGAAAAADAILAQDPRNVRALFLKATVAEARRDHESAASLYAALLSRQRAGDRREEEGRDRFFLVRLGFARQQLGRFAEAAEAFGKAATVGGEPDADVLGYRVEALLLAKDLDAAIAEARAARARFPKDADLATLEATALREKGDLESALKIVGALREQSPGDVEVLLQVAEFYQRARRYPDAEDVLREARAKDARNLRALFQLGAALERQKRHDEAEAVFRDALSVQPDSAPILNYLGYMNADRGVRVEEALELIEKAVALDPENGAYLDSLGWAQFRLNRLAPAEENLRRAAGKPGSNAVVFDHLGDALERRGNVAEALSWWQKALTAEDEDGELDRSAVGDKIRAAQKALEASGATPRPNP